MHGNRHLSADSDTKLSKTRTNRGRPASSRVGRNPSVGSRSRTPQPRRLGCRTPNRPPARGSDLLGLLKEIETLRLSPGTAAPPPARDRRAGPPLGGAVPVEARTKSVAASSSSRTGQRRGRQRRGGKEPGRGRAAAGPRGSGGTGGHAAPHGTARAQRSRGAGLTSAVNAAAHGCAPAALLSDAATIAVGPSPRRPAQHSSQARAFPPMAAPLPSAHPPARQRGIQPNGCAGIAANRRGAGGGARLWIANHTARSKEAGEGVSKQV